MADLATLDDIEAAIGRPPATDAESAKWSYYISSISAFVNNYVDTSFEFKENDALRLQADYYGILQLPGAPITSVASVKTWDTNLATNHYYNGLDSVTGLTPLQVVNVVYTHGYDSVPSDIKYMVTVAVTGALGLKQGGALKELTVGDVTEAYADVTGQIVVQLAQGTLDKYANTETTYRLGGTPGFRSENSLPTL